MVVFDYINFPKLMYNRWWPAPPSTYHVYYLRYDVFVARQTSRVNSYTVLFIKSVLCIITVILSRSIRSSNINMTPVILPYHIELATAVFICRDQMICNKRLVINQIQYNTVYSSRCSCMCEYWLMTKRCGGRRPRIGREGCTGHPGAAIPDFEGCGDFCLAMVLGDGDIFVTVTSGVPRNFVRGGGFNIFSWGERTGIWGQ